MGVADFGSFFAPWVPMRYASRVGPRPAPLTVRPQPSLWFNSSQIEFLSEDTIVRIIPKMSLPRMEFIRVRTGDRRTDSNACRARSDPMWHKCLAMCRSGWRSC